ncbi:hypothetical protein GOBAR_DD22224 [Gossypium barbadense]|nr:hypothetical protein GOBAR_DD22224 [Gossypium barbadense]
MAVEARYKAVKNFVYWEYGLDFNMPDVIDNTMLLFTTREREVNSGVREPCTELGGSSGAFAKSGKVLKVVVPVIQTAHWIVNRF